MGFFQKIWDLFRSTLNKFFVHVVQDIQGKEHYVEIAVEIVSNLNNPINSTEADIITAIIPGDLDDEIKIIARQWLPELGKRLSLVDYCIKADTPEQVLKCMANNLQTISPEIWAIKSHSLASLLAIKLSKDGLTISQVLTVIEPIWQKVVKPLLKK